MRSGRTISSEAGSGPVQGSRELIQNCGGAVLAKSLKPELSVCIEPIELGNAFLLEQSDHIFR